MFVSLSQCRWPERSRHAASASASCSDLALASHRPFALQCPVAAQRSFSLPCAPHSSARSLSPRSLSNTHAPKTRLPPYCTDLLFSVSTSVLILIFDSNSVSDVNSNMLVRTLRSSTSASVPLCLCVMALRCAARRRLNSVTAFAGAGRVFTGQVFHSCARSRAVPEESLVINGALRRDSRCGRRRRVMTLLNLAPDARPQRGLHSWTCALGVLLFHLPDVRSMD